MFTFLTEVLRRIFPPPRERLGPEERTPPPDGTIQDLESRRGNIRKEIEALRAQVDQQNSALESDSLRSSSFPPPGSMPKAEPPPAPFTIKKTPP